MFPPLPRWFCLWLLPLFLLADHVHWMGSYDAAHQKALLENKPLLVLVVKKNDPLSRTLLKNVFMNKLYIGTINAKYVPVIVTFEGMQNYPVEMYYTTTFPTLFFVDAQKELFVRKPLYGEEISSEAVERVLIR